jgi:hypothetical protein
VRIIVILLGASAVLGWLGFELRERYSSISQVLFALSGLLIVLLVGALFGLYGT